MNDEIPLINIWCDEGYDRIPGWAGVSSGSEGKDKDFVVSARLSVIMNLDQDSPPHWDIRQSRLRDLAAEDRVMGIHG